MKDGRSAWPSSPGSQGQPTWAMGRRGGSMLLAGCSSEHKDKHKTVSISKKRS